MDWQGPKLAEYLMQTILLVFSVVAFSAGYVMGSFQTVIQIYAGGVVLATLVTVLNWPWFSHPLQGLDPMEAEKHSKLQIQPVNSKKISAKM